PRPGPLADGSRLGPARPAYHLRHHRREQRAPAGGEPRRPRPPRVQPRGAGADRSADCVESVRMPIKILAFDGDDTLWHNETHFNFTQAALRNLLRGHAPNAEVDARLFDTELANLS